MNWVACTVHTTTMGSDLVSETLMECGASGTEITDRYDVLSSQKKDGMWDMIDENVLASMPEDVLVHAYFAADGSQAEKLSLAQEKIRALRDNAPGFDLGSLAWETKTMQDEDWQENWKQWYKPLRIGQRIVVKPTWEEYRPVEGDLVLEMDPGMAFGTGTHETTAMCVRMLEKHMKPGALCMDVGCGSGILALAAARLGAAHCLAIDLDELAVKVARENVEANHLGETVDVVQGDLLEQQDGRADVIVANIIADVICYLCRPASAKLNRDGVFICSGIISEKEPDVQNALARAGYRVIDRLQEGEWVCLAASLA